MTCLAGTVSMTCVSSSSQQQSSVPLAVYLAPTLIGGVAILAIALLAFLYWRRLAGDVASYKQLWHKRRYSAPPWAFRVTSHKSLKPSLLWCNLHPACRHGASAQIACCCACLQRRWDMAKGRFAGCPSSVCPGDASILCLSHCGQ